MNLLRAINLPIVLLAGAASLHCTAQGADLPSDGDEGGSGGSGDGGAGAGVTSGGAVGYGTGGVYYGTGSVPGTGGVYYGTGSVPGTGAAPGTGGVYTGTGGSGVSGGAGGVGGAPPTDGPTTLPGYENLAPPLGQPLDPNGGTVLTPPAPTGWTYYQIDGAVCRDGSPAGFFVHLGTADKLFWYLEGGGACTSPGFCNSFNPDNVNEILSGDGMTALGSAGGVIAGRQQPGAFEAGVVHGIFDLANAANPFKDWSMIYTPYCTGDVYFGTKANGTIAGITAPQQFVGYLNMQKFVARIAATFKDTVSHVILSGASAGSFGAALNVSMVQDTFDGVPVDLVLDSGVPFTDQYMPPCMQTYWRDTWGLNDALPPDCTECFNADGGGMLNLAEFVMAKHPRIRLAAISSQQDEIIRLFFGPGTSVAPWADCSSMTTTDPVALFLGTNGTMMPAADYQAALDEVRTLYAPTGRLASYLMGGLNITFHQHTWRARFYEAAAGGQTIAAFVDGFLNGQTEQVGP